MTEYLVLTKCGRRFCWSATGLDSLFRDMAERNYTVTFVLEFKLYEELDSNPDRDAILKVYERELKRTA